LDRKIPFLIAMGALGKKAQEPDLVMALIKRMSATELVTNTKMLERLGIKTNPVLRAAFEEGLTKVAKGKANVLKTSEAAKVVTDVKLKAKLEAVQEKQIAAIAVEGNWLILADRSPSMHSSVQAAKEIAGTLTKLVKNKVWLIFFDSMPMTIDITGLTLDEIKKATMHIQAGGSGTSIGCGLQRMLDAKEEVDGIVIVSDGEENTSPMFTNVYKKYSDMVGKEVPIYFYHVPGGHNSFSSEANRQGIDVQTFDLTGHSLDYYSLPALVQTMRTNRYSLVDEIMATPLVTLASVFKNKSLLEKSHVVSA
jgi:hypothetical protein